MFETNFTNWDWAIVVLYLLGTAAFGMYVNRHVHNAADYLVGGRQAGTALSIASFIGTGLGLVTLMYASMDGFNKGFAYLFVPLVALIVTFALGAKGFVPIILSNLLSIRWIPRLRPMTHSSMVTDDSTKRNGCRMWLTVSPNPGRTGLHHGCSEVGQ